MFPGLRKSIVFREVRPAPGIRCVEGVLRDPRPRPRAGSVSRPRRRSDLGNAVSFTASQQGAPGVRRCGYALARAAVPS